MFISIDEALPWLSAFASLHCHDNDDGVNAAMSYSIVKGDISKFSVDGNGSLIMNDPSSIDFDARTDIFALTVKVADHGDVPFITFVDIVVTVDPVNECPVVFPAPRYGNLTVSITEDSPPGTVIANLTGEDCDSNRTADGQISYTMLSGNDFEQFLIDHYGVLYLAGHIDREASEDVTLVVEARDGNLLDRQPVSVATVQLEITDVNDNPPVFESIVTFVSVSEKAGVGHTVLKLNASDGDATGPNNELRFVLSGGNSDGVFAIDATSGEVTLVTSLDFEVTKAYELLVEVVDGGAPPLSTSATVYVYVIGENEHKPIIAGNFSFNLPEDHLQGTLGKILVSDDDEGTDGDVIFETHASAGIPIKVDQLTNDVILTSGLDREVVECYEFVVTVMDTPLNLSDTFTVSQTITVTIDDVNDNKPTFQQTNMFVRVSETSPVGHTVMKLDATDSDATRPNNEFTFALSGGNVDSAFSIDSTTGELFLMTSLDYEETKSYELVVEVADHGEPPLSSSATVYVDVIGENEHRPIVLGGTSFNVTEDQLEGERLGRLLVSDDDEGVDGDVTFAIESTGDIPFTIDRLTGDFILAADLDREAVDRCEFVVTVMDRSMNSSKALSTSQTIVVTIGDVNDNKPTFQQTVMFVSVSEKAPLGHTVMKLNASDGDATGPNNEFIFLLSDGNNDGVFDVNGLSGELTLLGPLDYEVTKSYALTVEIVDGGAPPMSSSATIYVDVIGENEHPPVVSCNATFYVDEDRATGTFDKILATDDDEGVDGDVLFAMESTAALPFALDHVTGDLILTSYLDREVMDYYEFVVTVTDRPTNALNALSVTHTVTVFVGDVNDNKPTFQQIVMATSVRESQVPSRTEIIFTVSATDDDLGENANITYDIIGGDFGEAFHIDKVTGEIFLVKALDYETNTYLVLELSATDGGSLSSSAILHVFVLPTNEHTPMVTDAVPSLRLSLPEDTMPGSAVLTVQAFDEDDGPDGDFRFSLDRTSPFVINDQSGTVYLAQKLDRERESVCTLVITVTDTPEMASNALSSSVTATVLVEDVNDNPPYCTVDTELPTVNEDVSVGDILARVVCNDDDNGNDTLIFALLNIDVPFQVHSTTGEIRVFSSLDFEMHPQYILLIEVTDTVFSAVTTATIATTDANDNVPMFLDTSHSVAVREDSALLSQVSKLVATDADSTSNGNVGYKIFDGDPDSKFTIDSTTGVVSISSSLDREDVDRYELVLHATDNGSPRLTGTATLTVDVLDVNDEAPMFQRNSYNAKVKSTEELGAIVASVEAKDRDSGKGGEVLYYMVSGNDFGLFEIDSNSGEISIVNEVKYAVDVYALEIAARDGGIPILESIATVVIEIEEWTSPLSVQDFLFAVKENAAVGSVVGSVYGHGNNAYNIVSGNDGTFTIDANGDLRTTGTLDRESFTEYNLIVRADSLVNAALSASATVRVVVLDVNDNAPAFDSSSYKAELLENSVCGTSVVSIAAVDGDSGLNSAVWYRLDPSYAHAANHFKVDSISGLITVNTPPDHEEFTEIAFAVIASDRGIVARETSVPVTLTILNEDFDGVCADPPVYSREIQHGPNTRLNETLVTIDINDFGLSPLSDFSILAIEDTSIFTVDRFGGIRQTGEMGSEPYQKYVFRVVAMVTRESVTRKSPLGTVRIDTFQPEEHLIDIEVALGVDQFLLEKDAFHYELSRIFPESRVEIMSIIGADTSQAGSVRLRKLLQSVGSFSSSTIATLYVVSNPITDTIDGIDLPKRFLHIDAIMAVLQKYSDGTPADILMASEFEHFPVVSIRPTIEKTPWIRTKAGILFLVLIGLLFFVAVVCACVCIYRSNRCRNILYKGKTAHWAKKVDRRGSLLPMEENGHFKGDSRGRTDQEDDERSRITNTQTTGVHTDNPLEHFVSKEEDEVVPGSSHTAASKEVHVVESKSGSDGDVALNTYEEYTGNVPNQQCGQLRSSAESQFVGTENGGEADRYISVPTYMNGLVMLSGTISINGQLYDSIGQGAGTHRYLLYSTTDGHTTAFVNLSPNDRDRVFKLMSGSADINTQNVRDVRHGVSSRQSKLSVAREGAGNGGETQHIGIGQTGHDNKGSVPVSETQRLNLNKIQKKSYESPGSVDFSSVPGNGETVSNLVKNLTPAIASLASHKMNHHGQSSSGERRLYSYQEYRVNYYRNRAKSAPNLKVTSLAAMMPPDDGSLKGEIVNQGRARPSSRLYADTVYLTQHTNPSSKDDIRCKTAHAAWPDVQHEEQSCRKHQHTSWSDFHGRHNDAMEKSCIGMQPGIRSSYPWRRASTVGRSGQDALYGGVHRRSASSPFIHSDGTAYSDGFGLSVDHSTGLGSYQGGWTQTRPQSAVSVYSRRLGSSVKRNTVLNEHLTDSSSEILQMDDSFEGHSLECQSSSTGVSQIHNTERHSPGAESPRPTQDHDFEVETSTQTVLSPDNTDRSITEEEGITLDVSKALQMDGLAKSQVYDSPAARHDTLYGDKCESDQSIRTYFGLKISDNTDDPLDRQPIVGLLQSSHQSFQSVHDHELADGLDTDSETDTYTMASQTSDKEETLSLRPVEGAGVGGPRHGTKISRKERRYKTAHGGFMGSGSSIKSMRSSLDAKTDANHEAMRLRGPKGRTRYRSHSLQPIPNGLSSKDLKRKRGRTRASVSTSAVETFGYADFVLPRRDMTKRERLVAVYRSQVPGL
ncbi:protocadherin Fat 4-like [Ptychodera flava]|uniref:protocadherin Fat 4-like n=1 Tax=Ptychodera flava TaxID=63121 RepID=UPI00396A548C